MKTRYAGSRTDHFLQDEERVAETEAVALKRVLSHQIESQMAARRLTKTTFAERMRTSRSSLDRLLDPENPSVTLLTLEKAAAVLGRQLRVRFA